MPARSQSVVAPVTDEELAVNVYDLTRIDAEVLPMLLPPGTLDRTPIRMDDDRPDEYAVRLLCSLLRAATLLDVIRGNDRKCGDHPTRVYLRRVKAWERLPSTAVLTSVEYGKVVLNPLIFRAGQTLVAGAGIPAAPIPFGR